MKEKLAEIFSKNLPRDPLTEEESMLLIGMFMSGKDELNIPISEIDKNSDFYKEIKPVLEAFEIKVFLKRLEVLSTVKMTMGVLAMIMQRIHSVADVVMYAYHIHTKLQPNTLVDLNVFSRTLFPLGMFSAQQLREIWDAQKVSKEDVVGLTGIGAYDNLIDYKEMWEK